MSKILPLSITSRYFGKSCKPLKSRFFQLIKQPLPRFTHFLTTKYQKVYSSLVPTLVGKTDFMLTNLWICFFFESENLSKILNSCFALVCVAHHCINNNVELNIPKRFQCCCVFLFSRLCTALFSFTYHSFQTWTSHCRNNQSAVLHENNIIILCFAVYFRHFGFASKGNNGLRMRQSQ